MDTHDDARRVPALPAEALYRRCDPDGFSFQTTRDLEDLSPIVGQPRAVEAIAFGIGMPQKGYNLFALGAAGVGRRTLVEHFLRDAAREKPVPPDLCYVNNFEQPRRPRLLRLPAGRGRELCRDMELFVEHLRAALSNAFESEEYQQRRQAVQEAAKEEQEEKLEGLQQKAREEGLALLRLPTGFTLAPVHDGKVLSPKDVETLPEEERNRLEEAAGQLQQDLQAILRGMPRRFREVQEELRTLNRDVADYAVGDLVDELRRKYASLEDVVDYLDQIQKHLVDNVQHVVAQQQDGFETQGAQGMPAQQSPLDLYTVNLLVDHADAGAAPILYEENPSYPNLIGKTEHLAQMGTLVTDYTLIRPGALHLANGGFLVLDARKVLGAPFAWDGLKRALRGGEISIEAPGDSLGLFTTVSLEPEPVPLDLTVVLIGEPRLYYLLDAYDPDFRTLFKVAADFDDRMDRDAENESRYARLVAFLARREALRPLDRGGVARVVEWSAREADHAGRLHTHLADLSDLLREADYHARAGGREVIGADDVQQAVDAQIYRADRLRERIQASILEETIYISTEGDQVGQVNGLAVLQLGRFAFGKPSRITARVRLGGGEVVDIEREAKLGGPIHSKGVLILIGFLNGRYASNLPISLTASLVFEQSYGGIEGDSASCAELFALLSAIARAPVDQSLAVTGSVNQHGQVQPVGGVNEKIEGFFDVCRARGLTGRQGVVLAASNAKHLMLRRDVVEAVREERFHVYPIETVDEGLELLTGLPAGERDADGAYPEGSVNARIEERLKEFASLRRAFGTGGDKQEPVS